VNRVKTPPQRGISHLDDHTPSIFVASEWIARSEVKRKNTREAKDRDGSPRRKEFEATGSAGLLA